MNRFVLEKFFDKIFFINIRNALETVFLSKERESKLRKIDSMQNLESLFCFL